ncbi:MAG: hypothetical protein MRY64_03170 [Hyphomonadaceae bacterium]|nr:hypothetical protein [Hyphomonadaceae bacterium]
MRIFSVADLTFLDVFLWQLFAPILVIVLLGLVFPGVLSRPPLKWLAGGVENPRSALLALGIGLFVFVVHTAMTVMTLNDEKASLAADEYTESVALYSGAEENQRIAWATLPPSCLQFEDVCHAAPGGLHGMVTVLPEMQDQLVRGEQYTIRTQDNVLLEVLR